MISISIFCRFWADLKEGSSTRGHIWVIPLASGGVALSVVRGRRGQRQGFEPPSVPVSESGNGVSAKGGRVPRDYAPSNFSRAACHLCQFQKTERTHRLASRCLVLRLRFIRTQLTVHRSPRDEWTVAALSESLRLGLMTRSLRGTDGPLDALPNSDGFRDLVICPESAASRKNVATRIEGHC
jgi:hypothetical protein